MGFSDTRRRSRSRSREREEETPYSMPPRDGGGGGAPPPPNVPVAFAGGMSSQAIANLPSLSAFASVGSVSDYDS
jgi:hypothetical protein